jgi:hypothetical protein
MANSTRKATRHYRRYEPSQYSKDSVKQLKGKSYDKESKAVASWSTANVNEDIQDALRALRDEVRFFYSTDNFNEYEKIYEGTVPRIKVEAKNARYIFDVDTVLDTLSYLIDAQVTQQIYLCSKTGLKLPTTHDEANDDKYLKISIVLMQARNTDFRIDFIL